MATHITVLKFGGTSIQDRSAFKRVAQIVRTKDGDLVVIASAMSGVTDALIASFHNASAYGAVASLGLLEPHFERHLLAAQFLNPTRREKLGALIENSRREIVELLGAAGNGHAGSLRVCDAIASYGERLSARLLTLILEEHGIPAQYVDARRCVITDEEHGNAQPLFAEVKRRTAAALLPLFERKQVPVLGGFIGATTRGITTTLGRGSSDYSATLIGAALHAREIEIWTDVDGIQTADPRLVKSTRTVPHISYEEAVQLANLGARVMHPKMIEPVVGDRIPIRIRNSHAPEQRGTLISATPTHGNGAVKAIAHKVTGDSAIVGCVGHGLSTDFLSRVDSSLNWQINPGNLVAFVEPDIVGAVVRRLHAAIFE